MSSTPNVARSDDLPPLAQYAQLNDYAPSYSDIIIWSGFWSTWVGVVTNYDARNDELYVIFSTIPYVLFTLTEAEQIGHTQKLSLARIKSSIKGTFAIQKHDFAKNTNIWYL